MGQSYCAGGNYALWTGSCLTVSFMRPVRLGAWKCNTTTSPLDVPLAAQVVRASSNQSTSQKFVYTTTQMDVGGFTNGYYMGTPSTVALIMDRYHTFPWPNLPYTYEQVLLRAFQTHGISRRVTHQRFFKVRRTSLLSIPTALNFLPARRHLGAILASHVRFQQLHENKATGGLL